MADDSVPRPADLGQKDGVTSARPPVTQNLSSGLMSFASSVRDRILGQTALAESATTRSSEETSSDSAASTPTPKPAPTSSLSPSATPMTELFPKTDPAVDGDDCLHDCDSCTAHYPRSFSIDTEDALYGQVKGWSAHLIVATGKTDWKRDVADEKGSIMEALQEVDVTAGDGGNVMVSASDIPVPDDGTGDGKRGEYGGATSVLVLPSFTIVDGVTPQTVPALVEEIVKPAPTNTSPLAQQQEQQQQIECTSIPASPSVLRQRPCPHSAIILLCSQRTRDARCGQSAPVLRREFERHLRPLGLQRDQHDDRPGGVGVYFISHVGGHKYSANVIIYRRPDAFGLDHENSGGGGDAEGNEVAGKQQRDAADVGVGQCIWLARIRPEHCENIVRFTVMRGKVVYPETQLRGGFDRARGVMSW